MHVPNHTKIVTVAQMHQIEAAANENGHSYATMMEIAGRAVAEAVIAVRDRGATGHRAIDHRTIGHRATGHRTTQGDSGATAASILILVGPGNNGGDGLVCAQHLHAGGASVRVYLWRREAPTAASQKDSLSNGHVLDERVPDERVPDERAPDERVPDERAPDERVLKVNALGIEIGHAEADITPSGELPLLQMWLSQADIVVDALLGTGNSRAIKEPLSQILSCLKERKSQARPLDLVAVDCPSGLDADTGALDPHAVAADLTVTFAHPKWGHYIFPGANSIGDLNVTNIGTSPHLSADCQTFLIGPEWVAAHLPKRSTNSHKGSFGKVMALVGCVNYPGAAFLSCAAAGRVGAGLITGAVPDAIWPVVAAKLAEPTWLPIPSTATGHVDPAGVEIVAEAVAKYSALLVGCGWGQSSATVSFMEKLLASPDLPPMLIDADGLNCLAQLADWPALLPQGTILTPHAAEMARLCKSSVGDVRQNRWALAQQKAVEWNVTLLIKGPYTVVAAPDGPALDGPALDGPAPGGRLAVLPIATAALATAGTGDVLSGTIIGLLAQGLAPFEAACVGAWLHGRAGERCEDEIGAAGTVASDLLTRLPTEIRSLLNRVL